MFGIGRRQVSVQSLATEAVSENVIVPSAFATHFGVRTATHEELMLEGL
jgi:hypothetical protein